MYRVLLSAVASLLLAVGCCCPQTAETGTVNSTCPMGLEPVVASGGTTIWKGQEIGFCCPRCAPLFAALSTAEQAEALMAVDVVVSE